MRRLLPAFVVCLLVAVIALGACGGSGSDPAGDRARDRAGDPATSVSELLDWDAPTVEGGEIDARTLEGGPVAFWFWAPWCPNCNAMADDVASVAAEYADRVPVVGIAGRDDLTPMEDFVEEHGLTFESAVDVDGSIWTRFDVRGQPAFVFLAADGSHELVFGTLGAAELRTHLEELQ